MKRIGLLIAMISALLDVGAHPPGLFAQVVTVISNGDSRNRLDIAIVGDGYTNTELPKFASDANSFVSTMFGEEPYKEYQKYFNVRRVDISSSESGADHPNRTPPVFRNTALDASYNCEGVQRLICVNEQKVYTAVSVLSPTERDIVIVIVNDPEPGGSGGISLPVTSVDTAARETLLHELGHRLGLLADEYGGPPPPACDDTTEPVQANAMRQTARASIKWNTWIDPRTPIPTNATTDGIPGLYAGALYCDNTLYRPTYNSKMRSLGRPFEQINTEQLSRRFYNFVSPIDSSQPAGMDIMLTQGQTQAFSVATPSPFSHVLDVSWAVDGVVRTSGSNFILNSSTLQAGQHVVTAQVRDTTSSVRDDPLQVMVKLVKWNVAVNQVSTSTFDFAVDSLAVAGNVNGGAGFFDDFNDGSLTTPPTSNIVCNQNTAPVSESGGFLHLSSADGANTFSPGFLVDNCILGQDAAAFRLNDGSGNSVITASFRADLPGPGQGAGLQLFTFGTNTNELVNINFSNGPVVVALVQPATGPAAAQAVPINLSGVQRVMLRLTFNDATNQVTHSFSLNGGATFTDIVFPQPGKVMTTGSQSVVSVFGSVQLPSAP